MSAWMLLRENKNRDLPPQVDLLEKTVVRLEYLKGALL
jgi:hypothetical protein